MIERLIKNRVPTILLIFIFLVISTTFLYLFSFSTSSLYNYFGFDSAIFMTVGKSIAAGKGLYTEIFDHKGPILFFINALGWKLGAVNGIFVLQIVNLTAILYIIYKLASLFKNTSQYLPLYIIGLFSLLCFTNIEGNQSEEYSLLFLFIPTYFATAYSLNKRDNLHPPLYSLIYGVCFAIIAFNRITNAGAISGIVIGIFIFLLIKREWKNIIENIIYFIGGISIITIPIVLYFSINDSLYEMIYGTFIFNYKYSNAVGSNLTRSLFFVSRNNIFWFALKILPALLLIICSTIFFIKTKNIKLILITYGITILSYVVVNMGLKAKHYLTLNTIPLVLSLILFTCIVKDIYFKTTFIIKLALSLYIFLMLSYFIYSGRNIINIYKDSHSDNIEQLGSYYYIDKELVSKIIKEEDRNSVFGYNIPPAWYIETDMIPPYKYFTNQENWIKSDSLVYFETNKYLMENPPKWIIIPEYRIVTWVVGADSNPILKKLIEEQYSLEGQDINHKYYRRIN